jgi:FHS family glucose/mannose:H+ symporter-like MFS transporter
MDEAKKIAAPALLDDRPARNALLGFLLTGMMMGALGSLTVSWRYQLDKDPRSIGIHFFAFDAALLLAGLSMHIFARRVPLKALCLSSCLLAVAGFLGLALAAPPVEVIWRIAGVGIVGAAAGGLVISLLRFVRPYYERSAASTLNLCGAAFGLGSLLVTVIGGIAYPLGSSQWEPAILAILCVVALFFLKNIPFAAMTRTEPPRGRNAHAAQDFKSVTAILFSLLLFFQFGNEWALAGWLPLFLVRRLGMSPAVAIYILALFFLSLVAGRLASQMLRRYVAHGRLLFASVLLAMLGYLLLSLTNSAVGAALAAVVTGLAFAPVYALVAEKIGRRFDYEPGFFNGIFSLAIAGGILIPALLGFVAYYFGMEYVLLIPAFGSVAVLALMLLIVLAAKLLSGDEEAPLPAEHISESPKVMATGAGKNR